MAAAWLLSCAPTWAAADIPLPPTLDTSPQANEPATTVQPPPDLPAESDSRAPVKTEVNIIHQKEATVEEYRVNGKLRYAKITPKKGKPYYMVDTDGDGILDTRENNFENPPINRWILMEW